MVSCCSICSITKTGHVADVAGKKVNLYKESVYRNNGFYLPHLPQNEMRVNHMKTAVVYYSMSGNTKMIADRIADEIGADVIRIEPVKEYPNKGFRKFIWGGMHAVMSNKPALQPYRFDSGYDRIIFGTPVWASSFTPPIRTFIDENRDALKRKKIAVFVCYSGGGADKAIEKLRQFLEIEGFDAELILIDPKDRPSEDNEERIQAFCQALTD